MVLAKLKTRSLLFTRRADCTKYVYDGLNRRVNTIEPNGSKTTFTYDANSQMTGLIDPDSNRTTFVFDALGRQTQEIDALGKTITYTYSTIDQLTEKKDRLGQTIDYSYDAAGNLTGEIWKNSGGTITNTQTFTYDNANRMLTAGDASGTYTFTYDAIGEMLTQKDTWGNTLTFTYDAVGNRTNVQDSKGGLETSTYDAANNLATRKFSGVSTTTLRFDLTYNANNQEATINRYSDLTATTKIGSSTYTYDNNGNRSNLQYRNGSGTVLSNYTYTFDAASRVTAETLGGVTTSYGYDSRSELTSDGVHTYAYDNAGNRNNSGQTIGTGNRLSTDANWTYTYDNEGNQSQKVSASGPTVTWTYNFDVNNRMTSVHEVAGGNEIYTVTYTYDVFGNRNSANEDADGAGAGSAVMTHFALEGSKVQQNAWQGRDSFVGTENWDVWADLDGSNNLKTRYVRGNAVDELFARVSSAGTAAWYYTDRMGSVRQMVDASGTLQDTIAYDGFGNITSESSPTYGDQYKWAGREYNATTKLQYDRATYLKTDTGTWINEGNIELTSVDYNTSRMQSNRNFKSGNFVNTFVDGKRTAQTIVAILCNFVCEVRNDALQDSYRMEDRSKDKKSTLEKSVRFTDALERNNNPKDRNTIEDRRNKEAEMREDLKTAEDDLKRTKKVVKDLEGLSDVLGELFKLLK